MASFAIQGGRPLSGTVEVFGAKNAALKAIAAALLTDERCIIENVPNIVDVARMGAILESMGVRIAWDKSRRTMEIEAKDVRPERMDKALVGMLRASIVLLGPLLARFGEVRLPLPGGDTIGARPITTHVAAFEELGATIISQGPELHLAVPKGLGNGRVVLREFSVTATENMLMAAAATPGPITIELAAQEPHVANLAAMLSHMGAKIVGAGTHTVSVMGAVKLHGVTHRLVPDMLDAATFLIAGLVTNGDVTVQNCFPPQLASVLEKMREMGADVEEGTDTIRVRRSAAGLSAVSLQAMPYPGVPSDLGAPFAVLTTQAQGVSAIHDPLFENRFRYVPELVRMGASITQLDAHRIEVSGPTPLAGIPIMSFDIRAGAALVLAGLAAKGETRIDGIEHIDRGYEDLDGRLRKIGAQVQRIA